MDIKLKLNSYAAIKLSRKDVATTVATYHILYFHQILSIRVSKTSKNHMPSCPFLYTMDTWHFDLFCSLFYRKSCTVYIPGHQLLFANNSRKAFSRILSSHLEWEPQDGARRHSPIPCHNNHLETDPGRDIKNGIYLQWEGYDNRQSVIQDLHESRWKKTNLDFSWHNQPFR